MDTLWAPWRLEYLAGKREDGCIFCKKPSDRERLADHLILHVGELAFVILNRFPYHGGHLMVIPLRHTSDFLSLTSSEHAEIARLLQASRSEEHTSELQSQSNLVCRLLLEKKKKKHKKT